MLVWDCRHSVPGPRMFHSYGLYCSLSQVDPKVRKPTSHMFGGPVCGWTAGLQGFGACFFCSFVVGSVGVGVWEPDD